MALFDLPYVDLGGQPLVYDSAMGVIQQDPRQGGTNIYGLGDVFKDRSGRIVSYHDAFEHALLLTSSYAPPRMQPSPPPSTPPSTGGRVGQDAGSAIETTIQEAIKFLMRPIWPGDPNSLPTGVVLLGAVAAAKVLQKRR